MGGGIVCACVRVQNLKMLIQLKISCQYVSERRLSAFATYRSRQLPLDALRAFNFVTVDEVFL